MFNSEGQVEISLQSLNLSSEANELLSKLNSTNLDEKLQEIDKLELLSILSSTGESYDKIVAVADEILEKRINKIRSEKREKSTILKMPLYELGLSESVVGALQYHNVLTLEDASKHYLRDIRRWANNSYYAVDKIKELLESCGMSFKKLDRTRETRGKLIPSENIESMSEKDKRKFLSSSIECLGLSNKAIETLNKNGITKIEKLVNLSFEEINKVSDENRYVSIGIRKALARYGIEFETSHDYVYFKKPKMDVKSISEMSPEEIESFKKLPISSIGVSKRVEEHLNKSSINSIGDIINIANSDLHNVIQSLPIETRDKFLKLLKDFGINKKFSLNERYSSVQIDKVNVNDLSEEELKEFFANEIRVLGFSEKLIGKMNSYGISTIGDLSKLTRKKLMEITKNNVSTHDRIVGIMAEFGMELVPLSTKIKDTKIEIFNVKEASKEKQEEFYSRSIKDLGVSGRLVDVLIEKFGNDSIRTLIGLTKRELREDLGVTNSDTTRILMAKLNEFGLSLKQKGDGFISPEELLNLKDEEKAEILSKDLREFGVKDCVMKKLEVINIKSMNDLINTPKSYIRAKTKCNSVQVQQLEIILNKYGFSMLGSNCYVKDGKVVSKVEDIKTLLTERKVNPVDISSLSGEDKERMLDTKLKDLGLHVRALDLMKTKAGIETIRDIIPLYRSQLKLLLANNKDYIKQTKETLKEFGITFINKPKGLTIEETRQKRQTVAEQRKNKRTQCQTQEDFEELSLLDMGFGYRTVRVLNRAGIKKVGDLTGITKKEFIRKSDQNYQLVAKVKQTLNPYGLRFMEEEKLEKRQIKMPEIVSEISSDELDAIKERDIEDIGFANKVTKIFLQDDEIENFGDVLALTPIELKQKLGGEYLYRKLQEKLSEYGIEIPKYSVVNKAERLARKGKAEISYQADTSKEDKYLLRKLNHLMDLALYNEVKSRNRRLLENEFENNI